MKEIISCSMTSAVETNRSRWRQCLWVTVCAGLLISCGQDSGELLHFSGPTMGTTYTVKIVAAPPGVAAEGLQQDVEEVLAKINDQMSTYRTDSELSQLNRNETTDWVGTSEDLLEVLEEASRVSRLSDGAFDITVGPLVNLWGFGPDPGTDQVPSEKEIAATMSRVGYTKITTRRSPPAVKKARSDVYMDLSAIAKGYAVDKVAQRLETVGVRNYLVEIGGDLRASGHNAEDTPWKIAIEKPVTGERTAHRVVQVKDQALATSGDYRNYFERDGQRYSHTINPRQGSPIVHNLASVTVLSDTAMRADAMATALMVLGPEAGYALAERENIGAYFIVKNSDRFDQKSTPGFDKYAAD